MQLSRRGLEERFDYLFVILTVVAVHRLHQSVPSSPAFELDQEMRRLIA
jgi:hypothetical protein